MTLTQIEWAAENFSKITRRWLKDEEELFEVLWVIRFNNVKELYNIPVAFEQPEQNYLSEEAFSISDESEGVLDFLDGDLSAG